MDSQWGVARWDPATSGPEAGAGIRKASAGGRVGPGMSRGRGPGGLRKSERSSAARETCGVIWRGAGLGDFLILVLRYRRSANENPVEGGRARVGRVQASRGQGVRAGD